MNTGGQTIVKEGEVNIRLKLASGVFGNCHESTYRLYQSMMATRWRAKNMENYASSYSVSVISGAEPAPGDYWATKNNGSYQGAK